MYKYNLYSYVMYCNVTVYNIPYNISSAMPCNAGPGHPDAHLAVEPEGIAADLKVESKVP